MQLTFLGAADGTPLTKTFTREGKTILKHPYPMVRNFTSTAVSDVTNLDTFFKALRKYAATGHCLLKGNTNRPLVNESRRGSHSTTSPTEFVVLDIDGLNVPSVESFIDLLPTVFNGVGYITQASASMGIIPNSGVRAHLFMLLTEPLPPALLKSYLIHLNLSIPTLNEHIRLSADGNTLVYPLDITTCQNDKLIFIAPPRLGAGIEDPISKTRMKLSRGHNLPVYEIQAINVTEVNARRDARRDELREAMGLRKRKTTFRTVSGQSVISNPERAEVTGIKDDGEFIRLNLNGGDSWAYWHFRNNFEILYSFKGEDPVQLKAILPEYYSQLAQQARNLDPETINAQIDENQPIAFIDPKANCYWRGFYNPARQLLNINDTTKFEFVQNFYTLHNLPMPEAFPEWECIYDPSIDPAIPLVDPVDKTVNRYQRSDFLKQAIRATTIPRHIDMIITHVTGNHKETKDHFINWLAYIVQTGKRPGTAWVLHGTTGTGKGLLFSAILSPLLGAENTKIMHLRDFISNFDAVSAGCMLTMVDEADAENLRGNTDEAMAILRTLVTEERVNFKRKYQNSRMVLNTVSYIFMSNRPFPVALDDNDRRYNVAPRQELSLRELFEVPDNIRELLMSELEQFAGYLMYLPVDSTAARVPLKSAATLQMRSQRMSSLDEIVANLRRGDLEFFITHLPVNQPGLPHEVAELAAYERIIEEALVAGDAHYLPNSGKTSPLYDLLSYNDEATPRGNKLTSLLRKKGIEMKKIRVGDRTYTGCQIHWIVTDETRQMWKAYQRAKEGPEPQEEPKRLRRVK